jgi:endonuclease/exonuclease/phosphatase family metal-dependent hydrolase
MKLVIRSIIILFLLSPGMSMSGQLNIITYNIRLNTPSDGENAWPYRKDKVISLLKFHEADIFCLQEVLDDQMRDVDSAFQNFTYVGVGRDDGKKAGEYSPVFYNKERFVEISSGNFWLSETPGVPGLGWDAACIRICSWVLLEEITSNRKIRVFNTHFDHIGVEARKNAADLIITEIKKAEDGNPVILCGDFNLPPESVPVKKLSAYLFDSYTISKMPPYGPAGTWAGFSYDGEVGKRIDYIFVSKEIEVKRFAILTDSENRRFYSDHLPVFVEIEF